MALSRKRRAALIVEHFPYAEKVAAEYVAKRPKAYYLRDELHGAAMEGLVKAAHAFDASKGCSFKTYARRRVMGEMHDFLRAINPAGRYFFDLSKKGDERAKDIVDRTKQVLGIEADRVLEASRSSTSVEDEVFALWVRAQIARYIDRLDGRSARILRSYLTDESLQEIATAIGVTESRVCQIRAQLIRVMAEELKELREALGP